MGFKFNFGQAVAGGARRGSQRLQEMEDRANLVADRATARFIRQHDEWKKSYDSDVKGYNEAWDKLGALNLNGIKLDDGQKEMILLGGLDGADKFMSAYEDDQKRRAKEFFDKRQGPATIMTPMGVQTVQTRAKPPAWNPSMYTADMTKEFLNKTFIRTSDYQAALADPNNPKNQEMLKSVGLGQKKASMAYAQGKNPYMDIEGQTKMAANLEQSKQKSLLGITVPSSYIQSTIRDALVDNGIVKPEIMDEKLGANTGWQAPIYNALSTEDLMTLESNALDKDIKVKTFNMDVEKHQWAKDLNKHYIAEAEHKASLFAGEKKLQTHEITKAELIEKYNAVKYNVADAETMQKWDMQRAEYDAKSAKKEYDKVDVDNRIQDNAILEIKLKEELRSAMAQNNESEILRLNTEIHKLSKAIKSDMIVSRTLDSTTLNIITKAGHIDQLRDGFLSSEKFKLGFRREPTAKGSGTTVLTAPGEDAPIDRSGEAYYLIRNPIDGTMRKAYESDDDGVFQAREKKAIQAVNKSLLNILAIENKDGTFTNRFEGDESVEMVLRSIRLDPKGGIVNLIEYRNSLNKDLTFEEVTRYKRAIVAMRGNDVLHPIQRNINIPSEAEIKEAMMKENGDLFTIDEADSLFDALSEQLDLEADPTNQKNTGVKDSDSEVKFETTSQKEKRLADEAFQKELSSQKETSLKSVADTKNAEPYLSYMLKELVENKNTITKDDLSDVLVKQGMSRDNANNAIIKWLEENRNKEFKDRNGQSFRLFSPASVLEGTRLEDTLLDIGGSDDIVMDKLYTKKGL